LLVQLISAAVSGHDSSSIFPEESMTRCVMYAAAVLVALSSTVAVAQR
jgi:hypothetical protein